MLLPMVMIFAIFYFLLMRPMQKQRKAEQDMRTHLKNGDAVETAGGIIGSIESIDGDTLVLRVRPGSKDGPVKMQIVRSAITKIRSVETEK